jgi:hypothetical protein
VICAYRSLALVSVLFFAETCFAAVISLDCRVQYQKDGELWHRAVALDYDQKKLISVKVDGQPVYTFNLVGTTIVTSVDSERVRLEFEKNKTTWRSSLRDMSFGSGACVKIKS